MIPEIQVTGLELVHRIGLLLLSLGLLAVVLELVRRGMLKERYALLWLLTAATGLFVGFVPSVIIWIADLMKFQYLTVVFAMYFFFSFGLVMNFSIIISQLHERNRALTQEVALLAHALEKLQQRNAN